MDIPFVTSTSLSDVENNNSNRYVGFQFTNLAGVPVVVTQLARWILAGNNQPHELAIFTGAVGTTGEKVTSVMINASGAPTGYLYGTLSSPYTIEPGKEAWIVSSEVSGLDFWYSNGGTNPTTTNIGTIRPGAAGASGVLFEGTDAGRAYGPPNFTYSSPIATWTKSGTVYTCAADQYSVNSARANASIGDTINLIPSGVVWGAATTAVYLSAGVTLDGKGTDVIISPSAGSYTDGAIRIQGTGATLKNFTIRQSGLGANTTAINASAANWRVTNILYKGATEGGYFIYASQYGLLDSSHLHVPVGEYLYTRGLSNSWTTESDVGTAGAVYMEDCYHSGIAYTDFNSNGKGVVRYCTFSGGTKIDSHGYSTNDAPKIGVRQTEAYRNRFVQGPGSNVSQFEIRGGRFIGFENSTINNLAGFVVTDYGYRTSATNWGVYQTPVNYPLAFQVGAGPMRLIDVTGMVPYQWAQIVSPGTTDFWPLGANSNSAGTQFTLTGRATGMFSGVITGDGTVYVMNASGDPSYIWGNVKTGAGWPMSWAAVNAGAITLYRQQTNSGSITFVGADIIKPNRDIYGDANMFLGAVGVTTGIASQMSSTTPTARHGFWCANTGSWNTTTGANTYGQGQLYTGDGTEWVLAYTPYTYPHPLRGTGDGPTPPDISYIIKRLGRYLKLKGYAVV